MTSSTRSTTSGKPHAFQYASGGWGVSGSGFNDRCHQRSLACPAHADEAKAWTCWNDRERRRCQVCRMPIESWKLLCRDHYREAEGAISREIAAGLPPVERLDGTGGLRPIRGYGRSHGDI
jgi:hypothetical protein